MSILTVIGFCTELKLQYCLACTMHGVIKLKTKVNDYFVIVCIYSNKGWNLGHNI